MKDFKRENLLFSLCGLNCGLCPMNLNQYCPGCGGGEGNQSCSIAKCSLQHGNVEYCFQCENYPCERYDNIDEFDSFITHQHQKQDMENFRGLGIELYSAEQQRKKVLLNHLLNTYNDGRKKTLFCVAVNLLEIDDLENIINELDKNTLNLSLKEKAAYAASLFKKISANKNIILRLRKKRINNKRFFTKLCCILINFKNGVNKMKIEDIHYLLNEKPVDEKNFDIEKWRTETPMDYLKAMFLINTSSNKNEVFKAIYQVTRLYIPDILFKYFSLSDNISLNEQKLETLREKKIFMSETKYLNDPFDNKAYFYNPTVLKKYDWLSNYDGRLIDDFSSFCRITSLTANQINSMPMWAHYANNHTGFCVSYDMKCNPQLSSCTFPIQYTDQRIDITTLMEQQVQTIMQETERQSLQGNKQILLDDLSLVYLTSFFCNIKHISWSYEKEFRCSMGANAKGMPYASAIPKEIYIGMNCLPSYKDRIIKIGSELQIPVYQMIFDEFNSDFNLLPKEI